MYVSIVSSDSMASSEGGRERGKTNHSEHKTLGTFDFIQQSLLLLADIPFIETLTSTNTTTIHTVTKGKRTINKIEQSLMLTFNEMHVF